jgi:hypothetical protein
VSRVLVNPLGRDEISFTAKPPKNPLDAFLFRCANDVKKFRLHKIGLLWLLIQGGKTELALDEISSLRRSFVVRIKRLDGLSSAVTDRLGLSPEELAEKGLDQKYAWAVAWTDKSMTQLELSLMSDEKSKDKDEVLEALWDQMLTGAADKPLKQMALVRADLQDCLDELDVIYEAAAR